MENVVIIGSGPAGHTAAIYAARAKLDPLMLEGMMAGGVAAGGQLTTTTEVENYPGFPEGITGPELMDKMRAQSVKCGARIRTETVEKIELGLRPYKVHVGKDVIETKTIIIATGATAKRLSLPGEERLWQRGVSACAVCDGALPIFRDKVLVVIGGGDSACEEATYLTKYASKVIIVHRRHELRASKVMQERVLNHPKIEMAWNSVCLEIMGEQKVESVRIRDIQKEAERVVECGGLFYAIGHKPNTEFLNGQIALDETGYIKTRAGSSYTSEPGVFACGDVQDKIYRQAVTAAGSGCMAALDAERYITEHHI